MPRSYSRSVSASLEDQPVAGRLQRQGRQVDGAKAQRLVGVAPYLAVAGGLGDDRRLAEGDRQPAFAPARPRPLIGRMLLPEAAQVK